MADLPFSAELTDDSHVVHGLTVPTLCFRTLDSSDETLIDQSLSFLFFGVFLFLLRQSLLSAGEDESYLFYRAAYLHRLPLELEGCFFRDVLVGFFENTDSESFEIGSK